jgi:adenylate cyclase
MWTTLGKRIWEGRGVWFTVPGVTGLVLLLRLTGWLQPLEWMALDQFFRLRPPEPPDSRIVIVGINEDDLRHTRRWPIDDATLARLLQKIRQQQPRAIGLDLYRDFPVEPGYQELVAVFKTTPNLIGIEKKGGRDDRSIAPPPMLKQQQQVASNDIVEDGDGKIRRGMLYWSSPDGSEFLESLGLRLALFYLEAHNIAPKAADTHPDYLQLGQAVFPIFEANDGSYVGADAGGYQVLLNFRGPSRTFQTVSMLDVLQGRVPDGVLRDRIVFVGPTAESLKDFFYTPYSGNSITTPERMAGVEVQANLSSQILSAALDGRGGIRVWSDSLEHLWIALWTCVGAGVSWLVRSPRWATISMVLAQGSLVFGCYLAFLNGWWVPVIPPAMALTMAATVLTGYTAYREREERKIIMNLFERHVTTDIAEAIWRDRAQLLREGRLPGRKLTATVLFTDLKDFSTITERTDPEALMLWLNEYMEAMTQIVLDYGGVIDKFIGDSIMAVFGVPIARATEEAIAQDAVKAVGCAVKMACTLESLNQQWKSRGLPTTSMRVGISTGSVLTGSLGGKQRIDYTTIGDSVNVAARLESYDKSLDGGICRILISADTYALVQRRFPTRAIGSVQLKGREQPTKIYQVLLQKSS